MESTLLDDLSKKQYEIFKQFKENVQDVIPQDYSDIWLIKWLKACNYNLQKTERRFRENMATREVYKLDTILDWYEKSEIAVKYEFSSFVGFAKNGSLIRYIRVGDTDHIGFMMSLSGYEIILYCSHISEGDLDLLKKHSKKTGKEVIEITYILDMEGSQLQNLISKCRIEVAMDLIRLIQDHYPELWGDVFIVNAPVYFDKLFNLFKPIMGHSIFHQIRVVCKDSTPSLLLKHIDEDVLPGFLGGKKVDSSGDPKCSEFIKFGSKIPDEYYIINRNPLLMPEDPEVISLWVASRSGYNHSFVVGKPNSKVHIEIRTENGSIGVKLMYRPFGDDPENPNFPACNEYIDDNDPTCNVKFISPYARMQAHIAPIDTECLAPWPGIYIYRFDNSFSWFTSKRIFFRIRVVQP